MGLEAKKGHELLFAGSFHSSIVITYKLHRRPLVAVLVSFDLCFVYTDTFGTIQTPNLLLPIMLAILYFEFIPFLCEATL